MRETKTQYACSIYVYVVMKLFLDIVQGCVPNPKRNPITLNVRVPTCTVTYHRVQLTHLMRMSHALGTVIDIQR